MEITKVKILLEEGISRNPDTTWGTLTASSFNLKVLLTQNVDNMGEFTDLSFQNTLVDYTILIDKLNSASYNFKFMNGFTPASVVLGNLSQYVRPDGALVSDWFEPAGKITGYTDSRVTSLRSYNQNNPYIVNFDIDAGVYTNYANQSVNGVSRIISGSPLIPNSTTKYVFDANLDSTIGTTSQSTGFLMEDDNSVLFGALDQLGVKKNTVLNAFNKLATEVRGIRAKIAYNGEGWNDTNSSLSALTKEEYLMGIISEPEVASDVFIDRGTTTVMEMHLKLSEVESLDHLVNYGNGFYNIIQE